MLPSGWRRVSTPDYQRYTEGYLYIGPPWAGSSAGEYSQDEARHIYPNDPELGLPGNSDFVQSLVYNRVLVPRLYSQTEIRSWNGPPGGYDDYQASLWGTNYNTAYAQFLASVPAQYRVGATAATVIAAQSLPPAILSSVQTQMATQIEGNMQNQLTSSPKGTTITPMITPTVANASVAAQQVGISSSMILAVVGIAVAIYLLNK